MSNIDNTTKRDERRTRQVCVRFFMLAAFCAVATVSINCNPIIGCDFAHGMAPPLTGSALVIR